MATEAAIRPVPLPRYAVAVMREEDGLWCRVRLDVGQYSFGAGARLQNPGHPDVSIADATSRLINAINLHATERGWFGPELRSMVK